MKKTVKIIVITLGTILLLTIIDLISIFTINRPLLAIKDDCDCTYSKYKGLFYDTYNCPEFSTPQIKVKNQKYNCSIEVENLGKVTQIVDTTKNKKDFSCAEALEEFYKDDSYTYYYNCIKSKYIIVKYESGYEETVKNALKNGTIKITDLDKYNIEYIKYEN